MAFIGTESLRQLLKDEPETITPFNNDRIKNGAYELSLGAQVFQTDSSPRAVKKLEAGDKIEIKPGQFALLLTQEYVKIPNNKIAFISIKASVKFKGLVNVSGFHVDPGFRGNLLFSVYNAGPSSIILSQGTQYFPIWFSKLNETQNYEGVHGDQTKIPDAPVEALSQGELASPNALSKRIDDNQKESDRRISLLEKDQKANNYIAVTALGIVIAILLKFVFDWYTLKMGLDKGTELKWKEIMADSTINQRLIEKKRLIIEIDSLKKIKDNIKGTKKH